MSELMELYLFMRSSLNSRNSPGAVCRLMIRQTNICTGNHMLGRAIWAKLPECIFENFEYFKIFKTHEADLSQNCPNQTCGYWLITPNQQNFILKLISFNNRQLQITEWAITK